jgi:ribosomal protein S12 methylthiotransferase accessory factor
MDVNKINFLINDSEAQKTINMAQPAISSRTGIIQGYSELMVEPDDPYLFNVSVRLADTSHIFPSSAFNNNGGIGLTRTTAIAAALGECFERYSLAFYDYSDFILTSFSKLQSKGYVATVPSTFALFSENQYSKPRFPFKKFTDDSKINWVWGYSLSKKEPILVPASLIYTPYRKHKDEDLIRYSVSTGAACSTTKEEAILKGIYEVIERDAIMIMWLNKISCPLMDIFSSKEITKVYNERFTHTNLQFYVSNITFDIPIPVMFALTIDPFNNGLSVSVGAAANLDPETAALKALIESIQTRMWLKYINFMDKRKTFRNDFVDIYSFEDHVILYGDCNSISYVDFITLNQKYKQFDQNIEKKDISSSLKKCLEILFSMNLDVIVIDITSPDVANLGFSVVKVIIPQMIDLNPEHKYPFLGGRRLYQVPKMSGYSLTETTEENINWLPHPFP